MKILVIIFVLSSQIISAQRIHESGDKMNFYLTDASYLDSKDGEIRPDIKTGFRPFEFNWSGPDGFSSYDSIITQLKTGLYTVKINDALCGYFSDSFYIESKTEEFELDRDFQLKKIHPNPFTTKFNIEVQSKTNIEVLIEILDSHGRQIKAIVVNPKRTNWSYEINLGEIEAGLYILKLCNKSHCSITRRVLKI